jgi:phosphate-selective porin OprO/OprP
MTSLPKPDLVDVGGPKSPFFRRHDFSKIVMRRLAVSVLASLPFLGMSMASDPPAAKGSLRRSPEPSPTTPAPEPQSKAAPLPLEAKWKDGLRFESADHSMSLRIGGRIHYDWSYLKADPELERRFGPIEGGTEFRRARLQVSGVLYEAVEFKAEYDFAHGASAFKDVYVGVGDLPIIGSVWFGHMKEPMSLEELTSDSSGTFVERSSLNLFAPSRSTGAMIHVDGERAEFAAGVFKTSDDFGDASGERFDSWTARFSAAPWLRADGTGLLHVGVSCSRREPDEPTIRYQARPETHLSPRLLDTGEIAADRVDLVGFETALVTGPVSLQGEMMAAQLSRSDAPNLLFSGWYVQGSWILTGESRLYEAGDGEFRGVRPKRNFLPKQRGWGAFELAARWSRLVLSDREVRGGSMDTVTLGLNWYLNPQSRFMIDLARTQIENLGDEDSLTARFQVDF